jgi:hypothetical protein
MMISQLNHVHILVAALVYFVIGALWYSMLFGKKWMKLIGHSGVVTEADKKGMPMMFVSTFILNYVICFATACVIYYVQPMSIMVDLKVASLLGFGFVGTTTAMNNMYAKRSFQLTAIDAGYHFVGITAATIIMQMWH